MSSQSPPPPPGVVVCGSCVVVVAVVPIEIETTATVLLESHDGLKSLAYKPISITSIFIHNFWLRQELSKWQSLSVRLSVCLSVCPFGGKLY